MRLAPVQTFDTVVTQVASSATAVIIAMDDPVRQGLSILNASTQVLSVKMGTGASATSKTVDIAANGYFEVPFGYVGPITGLWASANGFAYVTVYR